MIERITLVALRRGLFEEAQSSAERVKISSSGAADSDIVMWWDGSSPIDRYRCPTGSRMNPEARRDKYSAWDTPA